MKNLYFLCLAKQNFKLTVLSKGYILQFSFDPLFIKLLFKILKMKRNRQPSNLIIFISSYSHITLHPSYILISSVIVCTRASFFSDEAPQWWWCHTRSRAVPDTVYPQLDQNILLGWAWVWSYILKSHLLVLVTYYECYENYTLLPEFWIINSVSALPTSSLMLSHIMALPGPASRWLMILQDRALTKPKTGCLGQKLPHMK